MDCAQCTGLVEWTCSPSAALGHGSAWQTDMDAEAASGQLYPAPSEATRFVLTRAQ